MNTISNLVNYLVIVYIIILIFQKNCTRNSFGARYHYKGKYTGDIQNPEIVIPQRVNKEGSFISHVVAHQHSKRSAKETELVFYKIPIEGKEYLIELTPNKKLISPGAVVETHIINDFKNKSHMKTSSKKVGNIFKNLYIKKLKNAECHYSGHVKGENVSKAALSTCSGLAGFIQIGREFYTIEPVAEHDPFVEEDFPHILYKPNALENNKFCGIKDKVTLLSDQVVRRKRESNISLTSPMFIETLVVMDKSLIDYHKESDCENYVLTVFNMAFNLFHDTSLGLMLSPTIVRIIRLEVENVEMNLKINTDAVKTLEYFQTWQYEINPGDDSHPNHHDVAILITRVNVCYSSTSCGLLGLSTIGKACDPKYSAALCEDNGLRLGFVIAHEIGHLLGADHDTVNSTCNGTDIRGLRTIMHPQVSFNSQTWSKCSQEHFKAFFRSGLGNCFFDEPEDHQFNVQDLLPGVMYNADFQCKHIFTVDARECDRGSSCDSLNCYVPGYACILTHTSPAEGTLCGEGMWCHEEKCIVVGQRPGAVDGNWGEWSSWSECTRTCGSGISSSVRLCNKPIPSHGGKNCVGERKRYKPCKTGRPSFRDVQCGEFDDWIYPEDGKTHTWLAFYQHEDNPCILYCINEENAVAALKPRVVDGTMCYRGIRDICIGGTCKTLPCDLHFESNAIEDACGVCHGDGTACEFSGGMDNLPKSPKSFTKLLDVPSGTRNIKVEEMSATMARIIVKDKESKDIYVKGTTLGMYNVPGSQAWLGMVKTNQEILNIPGPITKPVSIWIYRLENTTVRWSMALPATQQRKPEFTWDFLKWGPCSAKCGPGTQKSEPSCMEEIAGLVENTYCVDLEMPPTKVRPCEITKCEARWMVGDWKGCENSGKIRKRVVYCIKPVGEGEGESQIVLNSECEEPKPHDTEPCETRQKRENTDFNQPFFDDSTFISDIVEFGFHKKYNDYLTHFAAISAPQRKSETIPLHLLSSPHFKHYFRVLEIPENNENGDFDIDFSNDTGFDRRNQNKVSPDFYKNTFSGNPIDVSHMQSQFISVKTRKNAPLIEKKSTRKLRKQVPGRAVLKCLLIRKERGTLPQTVNKFYLGKLNKNRPKTFYFFTNCIDKTDQKKEKNDYLIVNFSNIFNCNKGRHSKSVCKYKGKRLILKSKRIRHSLRNLFQRKQIKNFNYTSPNLTDVVNSLGLKKAFMKSHFTNLIKKRRLQKKLYENRKIMYNGSPGDLENLENFLNDLPNSQEDFLQNYNKIYNNFLSSAATKTARLKQEYDGSGIKKLNCIFKNTHNNSENNHLMGETEKKIFQQKSYFSNPKLLGSQKIYNSKLKFKGEHKSLEDLISERESRKLQSRILQKRNVHLLVISHSLPESSAFLCETESNPYYPRGKIKKRLTHKWKKQKLKDRNVKSNKDCNTNGYGTETRNYLNNLFRDTRTKVATTQEPNINSEKTIINTGQLIIDQDPVDCQQIEVVFQDDCERENKLRYKVLPRPSPDQKLSLRGQEVFDLLQKLQIRNENNSNLLFKNDFEEDATDKALEETELGPEVLERMETTELADNFTDDTNQIINENGSNQLPENEMNTSTTDVSLIEDHFAPPSYIEEFSQEASLNRKGSSYSTETTQLTSSSATLSFNEKINIKNITSNSVKKRTSKNSEKYVDNNNK